MAVPSPSWGTHRVFGTWNNLNGSRKTGAYSASIQARVVNDTDDVIIPAGLVATGTLNTVNMAAPSLDINVPANDDSDNHPNDWIITLTITFTDGSASEVYGLDTPLGGETDLADIVFPQEISSTPYGYLRGEPNGVAALNASGQVVDASGTPVGGGVPAGGTTAQTIRKNSSTDGDTSWVTLAKADVGLGNVDNTSDVNKPVSTAQAAADALKAPLASPALTGTPTAPTASAGTNTTQVATTAFVTTADNLKANLASPTFTGTVTVPTPSVGGAAVNKTYADGLITGLVLDSLPLSVPGTITWNGSAWPARTTVTSQTTRRVIYIGNPGGSGPTDSQPNDVWTQG